MLAMFACVGARVGAGAQEAATPAVLTPCNDNTRVKGTCKARQTCTRKAVAACKQKKDTGLVVCVDPKRSPSTAVGADASGAETRTASRAPQPPPFQAHCHLIHQFVNGCPIRGSSIRNVGCGVRICRGVSLPHPLTQGQAGSGWCGPHHLLGKPCK